MLDLSKSINLFQGDCLEVMKGIESNSIASCIVDPPYNYEVFGRDWDTKEIQRRLDKVKNSNTLVKNIPYGNGLSGGVRNKRWYQKNRDNILEYGKWVETWGKELERIMKSGGYVFIFNSSRTVAHVQVAMENVGFYARDIFVWVRNSGIPKGLNASLKMKKMGRIDYKEWEQWHSSTLNKWEAISVVQKPLENSYIETLDKHGVGLLKTKSDIDDSFLSNIFEGYRRDKKDEKNLHITVKPTELIEKLIEISCPKNSENIVLDCFMGSGTTGVACKNLNRKFIGIELDETYFNIAKERIENI